MPPPSAKYVNIYDIPTQASQPSTEKLHPLTQHIHPPPNLQYTRYQTDPSTTKGFPPTFKHFLTQPYSPLITNYHQPLPNTPTNQTPPSTIKHCKLSTTKHFHALTDHLNRLPKPFTLFKHLHPLQTPSTII
jgi:hypothetical protein